MSNIPFINEDDMLSSRKTDRTDKTEVYKEEGKTRRDVSKKKSQLEKPIRIIRIKYYSKIMSSFMEDGKIGQKEVFAVDRSLNELLKALYYNTGMQGDVTPPDCIFVEKDNRMGSNNKFIFLEISKEEFEILKRQLENHTTIYAYNKGEFLIMEGKRSSLAETLDMPRIWKGDSTNTKREISDTNIILMRARLREKLKTELSAYHSYTDEQIDCMKEGELTALKKLSSRKMAIENKKRKKMGKLLK